MKIDISDIAIILNIENNKHIVIQETNTHYYRKYEDELLRCLKYFRKNAGKFKNINVYCLKFKNQVFDQQFLNNILSYNATIIEADCDYPILKTPYMLEVFLGQYFETHNIIKENILVKIDIDTVLIREFNDSLFENLDTTVKIGQYSKYSSVSERTTLNNNNLPFDNSFMIVNKKLGFFKKYFELCNSKLVEDLKEFQDVKNRFGNQYIVEFTIDYIYYNKIFNIEPIINYQIGEAYDDLAILPNDYLKTVYFIHHHIYDDKQNSFKKYYLYYLKIVKNK